MIVNLDRFELLNFLEGCSIGSHLRQGVWSRCVNEFYEKLNESDRDFVYQISKRDLWQHLSGGVKYPNVRDEYKRFGFEEFKRFLACYDKDNRYYVVVSGVIKGKVETEFVNAYKYEGKYWIDFSRRIPEEYIKAIAKVSETRKVDNMKFKKEWL